MKLHGHFLMSPRKLCSRMHVCVSIWLLTQMTSCLCLLILSGLAVSSQLGLEDVFLNPQDHTVREGEGVFFQCVSGESSPPASITWLKDGALVTRGRQIQGVHGGGNQKKTLGTLHLFIATLEDDGMYICVTHNPSLNISKRSKPAKLTVQGVPKRLQITEGPGNITVAMGTEVSMHCTVRGFPVPMVHWFKDSCLLKNRSTSFSLHNNGQLLTFRNVTNKDEGFYHCEASNQKETIKSQPAYLLPAEMDWVFIQNPTNMTVKKGENVTVTCRPPYSSPAAQVSWFKNNQPLTPTAPLTVLPNGDLFFHSVQQHDSGSYFCRASNIHLQRFLTSRRAFLTVLAPPSAKLWPQGLTVPLGARVVLECRVSGHPQPTITWVKRGYSKQTEGKFYLGLRNTTLYIQSARKYDEGLYVCVASNTLGQSHNASLLRVAVSPIIVTFVGQVSCRIGASAVLPCRAVGILPITYSWTRGRAETQSSISPIEDKHIDENGALHIPSVQSYHAGEYYCTAKNRAGQHQRLAILTVTDERQPADRGKQTRLVLSASPISSKELPASQASDVMAGPHLTTTRLPHVPEQHKKATCSLSYCDATAITATTYSTYSQGAAAGLMIPPWSLGHRLRHNLYQPTTVSSRSSVTQMQPPMIPPPPLQKFESVGLQLYTQLPAPSYPLFISNGEPPPTHGQTSAVTSEVFGTTTQNLPTDSQSHLTMTSSHTEFHRQVSDSQSSDIDALPQASEITESVTNIFMSQQLSKPPVSIPFVYPLTPTQSTVTETTETKMSHSGSVTPAELHQTQPNQLFTKPASIHIHQTKLKDLGQPLRWITQSSLTLSQSSQPVPEQSSTQTLHSEQSTIQHHLPSRKPPAPSVTKRQQTQIHSEPLPAPPKPTLAVVTFPQIQPQSSPTQHTPIHSQTPRTHTESFPFHHRNSLTTQPSIPTIHPNQTADSTTLDPDIPGVHHHQVNMSDQVQLSSGKLAKSANDTELIDWLKRNTSQSPMTSNDQRVTQQSPSWLPVLEKHDIPIVVGVGVSLAFIFITATFYAVAQKNERVPASRSAQRNLSVPMRHAERQGAGRTYENSAFEDDDCVAVIEQSPNTSDTRAPPPGPSLITVQMEPTCEDFQEETQPTPQSQSVTVETYPEPILDTKIDPAPEEEMCSLSQPSIQLQSAEDWTSNRGDNHSQCQDALPPPSSLPTCSPCPSTPLRQGEGLRSSLTLHNAEACVAPIHHSLSISHGDPPLVLSHHVSFGQTTVAVDVHFYPAATASMPVGTSAQLNTASNSTSVAAPLFSSPLVTSQENEPAARCHQKPSE